jgi:hypothetical protein
MEEKHTYLASGSAESFNEIQQIKKLHTSENGDWSTYKIWLASGRKRTARRHNTLKRKHPNGRGDIKNEGLVLEIW